MRRRVRGVTRRPAAARGAAAIGLVVGSVVMIGALPQQRAAAPDADPGPADLEEIVARTVAAPQARYAAEVRVGVAPHEVLVVRQEGAYDRASDQAWTETSWHPPGDTADPQVVERVHVIAGTVYLRPHLASSSVGLPPDAWLATPPTDAQAPDPLDEIAHSLGRLVENIAARTASGSADLRLDRSGRLRRLETAGGGPVTAHLELSYGAPVTVDAPDEAAAETNAATVLREALTALADEGRP